MLLAVCVVRSEELLKDSFSVMSDADRASWTDRPHSCVRFAVEDDSTEESRQEVCSLYVLIMPVPLIGGGIKR